MQIGKLGVVATAVLICSSMQGCGLGTIGVASATGGGSEDDPTTLESLSLASAATSPATIRYRLRDPDNPNLNVAIGFYDDGEFKTIFSGNQKVEANPDIDSCVEWEFADDEFGPEREAVELVVVAGGKKHRRDQEAPPLYVGNDEPEISVQAVAQEVSGNIPLRFTVSDTSAHPVDVAVEYLVEGSGQFVAARSVNVEEGLETPDPALTGVETTTTGAMHTFIWDSGSQLAGKEEHVVVRFRAVETFPAPVEKCEGDQDVPFAVEASTECFLVDNDMEPTTVINEGSLFVNEDERRGITVTFRVINDPGDNVAVLPQWRRAGEDFRELPEVRTADEVRNYLTDEAKAEDRSKRQVCTIIPSSATGTIALPPQGMRGPRRVRLPELGANASHIVSSIAEETRLQILRSRGHFRSVAQDWTHPSASLVMPASVLPLTDGLHALVLDHTPWRLRRVDLTTGESVSLVESGSGRPISVVSEQGETRLLVAHEFSNQEWSITRIVLDEQGQVTQEPFFVPSGSVPTPLRGIVSAGRDVALVTAGESSLLRVQAGESEPMPLLSDLQRPWGIVADPLHENRYYVAENQAEQPGAGTRGQITQIELDVLRRRAVVVDPPRSLLGIEEPRDLALERSGARLLVLAGAEIRGVDINRASSGAESFPVVTLPSSDAHGLATGPDGLRIVALPSFNELHLAGGVQQIRTLKAAKGQFVQSAQVVTVDRDFEPKLEFGRAAWCLELPTRNRFSTTSPSGFHRLLWDSSDVPGGGEVFLRLVPFDNDPGTGNETSTAKTIRTGIDAPSCAILGGIRNPRHLVCVDLNDDGLLDLVSANSEGMRELGSLAVFYQTAESGDFPSSPDVVLRPNPPASACTQAVVASDINGDGLLDLASANEGDGSISVFYQAAGGGFPDELPDEVIADQDILNGPVSISATDVTGDELVDLIVANSKAPVKGNSILVLPQVQDHPDGLFDPKNYLGRGSVSNFGPSEHVVTADMDGNGELDVLSADGGEEKLAAVSIYYQKGGTLEEQPHRVTLSTTNSGPEDIAVADFNGDGLLDFATANRFGNRVSVAFQGPLGDFSATTLGDASTESPFCISSADLDSNGTPDLITANRNNNSCAVFFARPSSSQTTDDDIFQPRPDLVLDFADLPEAAQPQWAEPADLNGDGLVDLAIAGSSGESLVLFCQAGPGVFFGEGVQTTGGTLQMKTPFSLDFGDLNGDGHPDVISANRESHSITAFFSDGNGTLPDTPNFMRQSETMLQRVQSVEMVDLNNDGLVDVVAASEGDPEADPREEGRVVVFYQAPAANQQIQFQERIDVTGPTKFHPVYVATADFDGDGDMELVAADREKLSVFSQISDTFELSQILTVPSRMVDPGTVAIAIADIDGAYGQDIVSANTVAGNLAIFLRTAEGTFEFHDIVDTGGFGGPLFVAARDIDGDERVDLVAADSANSSLAVFLQNESGKFDSQLLGSGTDVVPVRPHGLTLGDFDQDGQIDIASCNRGRANSEPGNISIFLQTIPGRFSETADRVFGQTNGNRGPQFIIAEDLDGDNELDLITAGFTLDHIKTYFGDR